MMSMTNTSTAKPEPGTIKQIAWCNNCDEMIERTKISNGWYHPKTEPEPGTIKQIAWCNNCDEMIERTKISNGWYHPKTGYRACFGSDGEE